MDRKTFKDLVWITIALLGYCVAVSIAFPEHVSIILSLSAMLLCILTMISIWATD